MARQTPPSGRLIAVEGSRGADVERDAGDLADRLRARGVEVGISRWDASGIFADLLLAESTNVIVSPRMLALMYAADLVFRLRWEIQPILAEGRVVIAAPYVETAIGVCVGLTLPEAWLREVFRFAPAADLTRLCRERKAGSGWRPHATRGFGEYSTLVLANSAAGLKRRAARDRTMDWLADTLEPRRTRRKAIVESLAGYEHPAGTAKPSARAASQRT